MKRMGMQDRDYYWDKVDELQGRLRRRNRPPSAEFQRLLRKTTYNPKEFRGRHPRRSAFWSNLFWIGLFVLALGLMVFGIRMH
jgi:hypothetical protein